MIWSGDISRLTQLIQPPCARLSLVLQHQVGTPMHAHQRYRHARAADIIVHVGTGLTLGSSGNAATLTTSHGCRSASRARSERSANIMLTLIEKVSVDGVCQRILQPRRGIGDPMSHDRSTTPSPLPRSLLPRKAGSSARKPKEKSRNMMLRKHPVRPRLADLLDQHPHAAPMHESA